LAKLLPLSEKNAVCQGARDLFVAIFVLSAENIRSER